VVLANACFDSRGQIGQWPRQGDWFSQNTWEMETIRLAWYVQAVYTKRIKWEDASADFLLWLDDKDDDETDLFIPRLHLFGEAGIGELSDE
jgi:hypothetical protein